MDKREWLATLVLVAAAFVVGIVLQSILSRPGHLMQNAEVSRLLSENRRLHIELDNYAHELGTTNMRLDELKAMLKDLDKGQTLGVVVDSSEKELRSKYALALAKANDKLIQLGSEPFVVVLKKPSRGPDGEIVH